MKKLVAVVVLLIIIIGGFGLYYREGLLPINPKDRQSKLFVIEKGSSVTSIVRQLHQEGFIRDRIIFFLVIKQMGIEENLQAGDFRLSPSMTAKEIATALTKGSLDLWVTIIEGTRKEEIAETLSKTLGISQTAFVKEAKEGYLFPDTYLMPRDASVETVLKILNNNFKRKFTQELVDEARQKGLNQDEVLTLASLLEREAKKDADRLKVASILKRRLELGMPLQIDATVQYAIGYQDATRTWWKKNLTKQDLQVDSPYNTYKYPGMPPGPIANPGLASIKAVIQATPNTPYLYYISDMKGIMHYARDLDEHNANVAKYLR